MCRILAINNLGKKEADSALSQFRNLADCGCVPSGSTRGHRDGWGIAAYRHGRVNFWTRNPRDAFRDPKYPQAVKKLLRGKFDITIGHLRKSSIGTNILPNTQPFVHGKYVFAHNGTIFGGHLIPLERTFEKLHKGKTDSEKFFLLILGLFSDIKNPRPKDVVSSIRAAVAFVRDTYDYTAMNVIFSDGRYVWALREINLKNKWVKSKKLVKYYTLFHGAGRDKKSLICSEKLNLPGIKWHLIPNHGLIQIDTKTGKATKVNM